MSSPFREEDIRPAELFNTYLALATEDISVHFEGCERQELPCPACGDAGEISFNKLGFDYRYCFECQSLWMSPRPIFEAFASFYSASRSAKFWAEVFYPSVEEMRRVKLWQPKARKVLEIVKGNGGHYSNLVDIGGGSGIFAHEIRELSDMAVTVIEPSPESAAVCRARKIDVLEQFLEKVEPEQLPAGPTVFTSFELFEHVHDPTLWFKSVVELMKQGDLFVLTTLSGTGVDIQTLWENSPSVHPPHHINFLNPRSIVRLGESIGLSAVEVFTPGVLDLDIMRNNLQHVHDRFWQTVLSSASESEMFQWQQHICDMRASSHMWGVFRRK